MKIRNPFSRHGTPAGQEETGEMILLTLARAEENANVLSFDELARELELTRPVLEAHLHPLLDRALLKGTSNRIVLTNTGRERARSLLRRHRLTERLFTDIMGLDWAHAHTAADKYEHMVSAEAEAVLATQLGDPETCPHGNPIPSASGYSGQVRSMSLGHCIPPVSVIITRIGLETPAALQHLATLGLLPNVEIQVENKAPFDGPIMVRVGRAHYALGHDLASRIWVCPCTEAGTPSTGYITNALNPNSSLQL